MQAPNQVQMNKPLSLCESCLAIVLLAVVSAEYGLGYSRYLRGFGSPGYIKSGSAGKDSCHHGHILPFPNSDRTGLQILF